MMQFHDNPQSTRGRRFLLAAAVGVLASGPGCAPYVDRNVPQLIQPRREPELGRRYLLYRPSSYDRGSGWPLIVVCHSSFPDSPNRRIRAWTQQAESRGFLLLAPTLVGVRAKWPTPRADRQIALQREDERHILAAVQHVRAGHNVSEDRIFIHGFSGGALSALHTGLRHPELFRAVSLTQPKFNGGYLTDVADRIDAYQPVYVHYDVGDALTGHHARDCVEWLRTERANLREDPIGSVRAGGAAPAVGFFEEVIRRETWIRIRAYAPDPARPREIQFKLASSAPPRHCHWEFGDGEAATTAEPAHTYAVSGTYKVTVKMEDQKRGFHSRVTTVHVP